MLHLIVKIIWAKDYCFYNRKFIGNGLVWWITLIKGKLIIQKITAFLAIKEAFHWTLENLYTLRIRKIVRGKTLKPFKNTDYKKKCFKPSLKSSDQLIPNYKIENKILTEWNQNP
jgi:hypothetical protein